MPVLYQFEGKTPSPHCIGGTPQGAMGRGTGRGVYTIIEFARKDALIFAGTVNEQDERDLSTLTSFTLKHCGSTIGWGGFKKNTEETKTMTRKYGAEDHTKKIYNLATLTHEDTFIIDLFQYGNFFSVEPLQVMAKVRDAIKVKAAKKDASLEEILKEKN